MTISEQFQQYINTVQFFDDSTDDYLFIYDLTSERVFLTDKIREKFPIPPAGEEGNDFSDWYNIVYPKDLYLMNHYRDLLVKREIDSFDINYRIFDREGNKVWVRVKANLQEKYDTQSLAIVGRVSEITSVATIDILTGLYGIEKFTKDINEKLTVSNGYLMIVDIDNFQSLNMAQGRAYGNTVLKKVATTLDEHTRYPMELYRLEGDSFAINLINKNKDDVENFYNEIKTALNGLCTISAGAVRYSNDDTVNGEEVYLYAETALKQAKKEKKDRLVFFSDAEYKKDLELAELLYEIKTCIRNDFECFSIEYQPQIDNKNFSIYGVEALLRYDSPTRGRISPVKFIPLLELTKLICPVGEWVLKKAVAQCKEWRKYLPDLHIGVNLSYIQLEQEDITNTVLTILEEAQLPGSALTLELTENMQLQNYTHFNKIFYIWKQNGIKISIDDFGTGYSSLSYLKQIEINEVKIDKCFVTRVQHNDYNFRLLRNMIELAHSANIDVSCEGVETIEELMALQELNTDILQGFFFSKPCTVHDFEQKYICKESKVYLDRLKKESNLRKLDSNTNKDLLEKFRNEDIGNITESMDELVYVSDIDTYELYYMNAAGRRMTGVYDYKGCKCYKVLQGKDEPCEFCTNAKLNSDNFLIWEIDNKFLKRHLILKDKLIPWKGKMSRVELAFDITEKEIISKAIQERLDLKRAIVDSYKILSSENDINQSIVNALKTIGYFCKSDRTYILTPCKDDNIWNLSWEWYNENNTSLKNLFPARLNQNFSENTDERMTMQIKRNNIILGLIVVDNPKHKEDIDDFLETISHFLGFVLETKETKDNLNSLLNAK